jgi:hypothetical protein
VLTLAHLAQVFVLTDDQRLFLVVTTAVTTVASWVAYFIEGLRALRQRQPAA